MILTASSTYDDIYAAAIANGASPLFADMLASRKPFNLNGSDAAFVKGFDNLKQFDRMPKEMAEIYLRNAKAAGINTHGKMYMPELARNGMGAGRDPDAWVSASDGARADVKKVCEQTNRSCTGMVEHTPVETPPSPVIPLAEDLIQRKVREIKAKEPGKKHDARELRERVIEKHAPAHRRK